MGMARAMLTYAAKCTTSARLFVRGGPSSRAAAKLEAEIPGGRVM
jgi:CRISPR/Cas system-associated exonuclease Cas4 (RecB family)